MSQRIVVRLPEEQVRFLDHLVASGEAQSRAELVGERSPASSASTGPCATSR